MSNKNAKRPSLLQSLFEWQAQVQPMALAVSSPSKKLSYEELSKHSNQLAYHLVKNGAAQNQLISVAMEKGWEQVVAVLGVVKSGAAYLPLDPHESKERLQHLLEISNSKIVLIQAHLKEKFFWLSGLVSLIVVEEVALYLSNLMPTPINQQSETDLAYVIFTSGSTGEPKGVMIDHKSAMNTIMDVNQRFGVTVKDRVLSLSALSFDLSVYDIFGALSAGAAIVFPAEADVKEPTRWIELFIKEEITIWNSVPSLLQMFVQFITYSKVHFDFIQKNHSLRLVLLSGDWIPVNFPEKIFELFGKINLISLGGATEASIWSVLYPIKKVNPDWKSIPYGKAMLNQRPYVFDESFNKVIVGVPGELYIGGVGVARGYWRDPQRTRERFISHPRYGKLYKTGDLGQYMPDGNIEFLGRIDHQTKVHGYRVETSAIESCLLEHPELEQCVVTPLGCRGNEKLIAYVVPKKEISALHHKGGLCNEQVHYWRKLYNEIIDSHIPEDSVLNLSGWISSFDSKPIPKEQMQEWIDNTVSRILETKPSGILEIGCGTGLLLFQIAPKVQAYYATDFSESALSYVRRQIDEDKIGQSIELNLCEAIDFSKIPENKFDTIVINSVAQYFPSIEYFDDVIRKSVSVIKNKGHVFVGDVRSFEHLRAFHNLVQFKRSKTNQEFNEWDSVCKSQCSQEDELAISPEFFYRLKERIDRISGVKVEMKRGRFINEMNSFRYDVTLFIEDSPSIVSLSKIDRKAFNWVSDQISIEWIRDQLDLSDPKLLNIYEIPNKAIAGLLDFSGINKNNWRFEIRRLINLKRLFSVSGFLLYDLAEQFGYKLILTWSSKSKEAMDAFFYKPGHEEKALLLVEESRDLKSCTEPCANIPVTSRYRQRLIVKLRQHLQTRVPEYMIPSSFVISSKLPMGPNGKINRQAVRSAHTFDANSKYKPPTTKLEHIVSSIWSSVVNRQAIGIYDNFFEVGGSSFMAIQILLKLQKQLGISFSIRDITHRAPTIADQCLLIEELSSRASVHGNSAELAEA